MNEFQVARFSFVSVLTGLGLTLGIAQTVAVAQVPTNGEYGMQVLTRGPIHEAFAETITFDPEPGIVVMRAPPERIEELPPDQRPDGINVDWIPGYWGWDDERSDFLWISGVWRALPPGREWVPGYWSFAGQGHQWISGYWADSQRDDIEYLPEPPATVEIGPNIGAPSADYGWIPGSWVWYENRYAWRPGFWMMAQPDWEWIPAHYVCSPRGYLYVDGYWDHTVSRRGVLYAPVYFQGTEFRRHRFSYSPSTVINISVFSDHLFVRPRYNHYYFGDYYAPSYRDAGFYASFSFHTSRRGYEPISRHERWRHRQNTEWDRHAQANFDRRRDHEDERPRRTLAAQVSYANSDARRGDRSYRLARSAEEVSRYDDNGVRLRRVDDDTRQSAAQRAEAVQRFRNERQRSETDRSAKKASKRAKPVRVKARRSPIAAKPVDQLGKNNSPPRRPEQPRPDPKVKRKSKSNAEKHKRP